jgi:hypothetical protein
MTAVVRPNSPLDTTYSVQIDYNTKVTVKSAEEYKELAENLIVQGKLKDAVNLLHALTVHPDATAGEKLFANTKVVELALAQSRHPFDGAFNVALKFLNRMPV